MADGSDDLPLDLVERLHCGDEDAFALLYRTVHPGLVRYAATLVGQDCEDVTAEAWLQIARDIRSFRGDTDALRAWCARIVRNRSMDHWRSAARRPVSSVPLEQLFEPPGDRDASDLAIERITTEEAVALIVALPRDQAEAVMLRAVIGLDARSAGQILGKSAGAVRVLTHRGLKTLAKRIARQ